MHGPHGSDPSISPPPFFSFIFSLLPLGGGELGALRLDLRPTWRV
uniref:Uncharacterized protein n=1 Tax=Arundo donax TaxID=35708 RepID=A0A0A9QC93_ARUDO